MIHRIISQKVNANFSFPSFSYVSFLSRNLFNEILFQQFQFANIITMYFLECGKAGQNILGES